MNHRTPLLLSILALTACCHQPRPGGAILPDTLRLEAGDVVFRRCTGLASTLVVRQDTGGIFSHVGIVVDSAGVPMIVHAVPGEPDYQGDPDRVKMSRPAEFYARGYAQCGAVCRPCNRKAGYHAARKAMEVYRRGTLFDHDYDDRDTTRMYCTELIVDAYHTAGIDLVGDERRDAGLPLMSTRFIMPSQVFNSPHLQQPIMFNP